ncbi:hypothetical protein DN069_07800 [Streptacidiphilus pinicola]|uniref:Uncharacterized protein n=1 Tax=Streptacidiphilus pinicola TaxID=2219663 RepID=A0A2X0IM33_9ACTN|nr:hypothetical protein DN069_07800 [Streptacidiphilus pinicola]
MAALRDLAINTLRDAGHQNVAAGLRHASYEPFTTPPAQAGISARSQCKWPILTGPPDNVLI